MEKELGLEGHEATESNNQVNLEEFINNYTVGHDNPITSQMMEAITFKDPSKLFVFVLDYNHIPQQVRQYITDLKDFYNLSKQFSKSLKTIIARENRAFYNIIKDLNIRVRLKNFLYNSEKNEYPNLIPIRSLNSSRLNRYICFRGIVRNVEVQVGSIVKQKFRCLNCHEEMVLDFNDVDDTFDGKHCIYCQGAEGERLEMIRTIGGTIDTQLITVEEFTNDSESDASSVTVRINGDDITNTFNLGDPVVVTGNIRLDVYNETTVSQFKKKLNDMKLYKYLSNLGGPTNGVSSGWFVEANYIEKINDTNIIFNNISDEQLHKIEELSKDPHLVDKLIQSFAPNIYGHEIEKEVMIYQLMGGLGRTLDPEINKRGEIHVFFLGDPGTAKSELMEWSLGITHKCRFVYGGSISGAGLTAGVDRSEGSGNWVVAAGAAVVADKGILGIDELNHASPDTIKALNQIMEKQSATVTKIKSGTFHTRVAVIACANPPDGNRYNKRKSFMENIGINTSLFTRFDYIGLFRDIPNPEIDAPIVRKIIETYNKKLKVPIPRELLAQYIYYMKHKPDNIPTISQEAQDRMEAFYIKIRTLDMNENIQHLEEQEHVSITARQVESLMRFAYARARLLNKPEMDVSDVESAERIITHMLNTIGVDPETGKVDASILNGSKSASQMSRDTYFFDLLDRMAKSFNNKVDYDSFVGELRKQEKWKVEDISDDKLEKVIQRYQDQQYIIIVDGYISLRKSVQHQYNRFN